MKIKILGTIEVTAGDRTVDIRAKRLRALLAVLLLNVGNVVTLDRIIDGIWPDEPPRSVVKNVRTYVSQLRSLLSRFGSSAHIESHPRGYRMLIDAEALDLLRFTALAADGRRALARGDYRNADLLLSDALQLWRGAPLGGLDIGSAMRAKIAALEEQHLQVEMDWISARLAMGQYAELAPVVREMLAERPLDEALWCHLVTALYLSGRTAQALAAIDEARQVLIAELGIEPGPGLQKLQSALLDGRSLPEFAPRATTPMLQLSLTPQQLPPGRAHLVGRTHLLERCAALSSPGAAGRADQPTVIMVSGPPGVGKSAGAITAAAKVRNSFPNGQLYVDLRGSTERPLPVRDALSTLLSSFGITSEAIPDDVAQRSCLLRSLLAERQMLVVIDDALESAQVEPLIPGPGSNMVIITSRRRLNDIDVTAHLVLEPLSRPEAVDMLGSIVGSKRMMAERDASVFIVEACGRLPGAIRNVGVRAAARPDHPLRLFAERLGAEDRVLDEVSLDGHSLRGRLDVSYAALDPRTQACFRSLGRLNHDSITAADLATLCRLSLHHADWQLERLVYEGLVSTGPMRGATPQYRMHRLVHLFARERLRDENDSVQPSGRGRTDQTTFIRQNDRLHTVA